MFTNLPKYLRFTIASFLSNKDLFKFSITCKTNNLMTNKSFWKFKLGKYYDLFNETKPQTLSYLQWLTKLETCGTPFSEMGTLCLRDQNATWYFQTLINFVDISGTNVWYTDVFHDVYNWNQYKMSPLLETIRSCGKMISVLQAPDTREIYMLTANNDFLVLHDSNVHDMHIKLKSITSYKYGCLGLAFDGTLTEWYRCEGRSVDRDVESITNYGDIYAHNIIYVKKDGTWFEYDDDYDFVKLLCDPDLKQVAIINYRDSKVLVSLDKDKNIKFHDYQEIIQGKYTLLKEIMDMNVRKIIVGYKIDSLYFIDHANNLYVLGQSHPSFKKALSFEPCLLERNVLNLVENFGLLAVIKE